VVIEIECDLLMITIIPKPVSVIEKSGSFSLSPSTTLYSDSDLLSIAHYLQEILNRGTGFNLSIKTPSIGILSEDDPEKLSTQIDNGIVLKISTIDNSLGEEGYRLDISGSTVIISAQYPKGVFYGIQSLRQLFPPEIDARRPGLHKGDWIIPCVSIRDFPRFPWRGYMLDVCRHMIPKDHIFHILDLMALHKLNVFHWHLVEDQGWRIEIKKYPKLTEIASKRKIEPKHNEVGKAPDPTTYGGYFTQDDVKEVVTYAGTRFIQVVPEIEMPGHSMAAITAYPELSCTGGPFEVPNRWGVFKDVYCAGKEQVFEFVQDVLDEVMELFPSPIIHIGGDEVPKDRWKNCPACQKRMRDQNITDEEQLQTYFTNRIAEYLAKKGRRLMGWNEILNDKLIDVAIGQFWMGKPDPIVAHLKRGRDIVVSRGSHVYLDHSYRGTSLRKCYSFEPVPEGVDAKDATHVLGVEAPMWTERVPTPQRMYWQTFPRLTAVAEIGWTPAEQKDIANFYSRFKSFRMRLNHLGVPLASEWEADPGVINQLLLKIKK
jgi:hexosaminidase